MTCKSDLEKIQKLTCKSSGKLPGEYSTFKRSKGSPTKEVHTSPEESFAVKMRDAGIEINIEEDGGSFNWVEDVEVERPPWTWYKDKVVEKESEKEVVKKKRVKRARDAPLTSTPSYPHEMRVGTYLAMREGPEGMRKLKMKGVTDQKLEENFMQQILRRPGICQNPAEGFQKFDVEKLDEEAVKKLISGCASGPMIKSRLNPASGRNEHFVVLLAMSPGQGVEMKADKEEGQQSDSDRKPRPEVNIYSKYINTIPIHFMF